MDVAIKKKSPLQKYKYYIIAGVVLAGLLIYFFFSSLGGTKLRYDSENLQV